MVDTGDGRLDLRRQRARRPLRRIPRRAATLGSWTCVSTVATEHPVTGSCERCARRHDMLIPEPGSGDLDFERIRARFSWCAGCSRIVGRTCCWDGSSGLCPDCAALRERPNPSMTDVVLTRTALSGLTAAADAMGGLERRLQQQRVTDEEQASNAWEDAWLETGIGILRADGAVRAARTWGATASVTPADAQWLHGQLATLGATWEERYHAVADRLERVGLRIRALGAVGLPAATPPDASPEPERVPLPVGPTLSPVTRLPTREPAPVGAPPPAPVPSPPSEAAAVPSWPPSRRLPTARLDLPDQPVAVSQRRQPVRPAPPPRLPPSARPDLPAAWEGRPVLARPAVARRHAPMPARARTVGRQVVMVLLVLLALIGLVVTAALTVELLGFAAVSLRGPLGG